MAARALAEERAHLPRSGSIWGWTLGCGALILLLDRVVFGGSTPLLQEYARRIVLLAGINVTLAVSLNVINGITGQFSIGHAGFMAVGAYVSAAVTVFGGTWLEVQAAHGHLDANAPVLNLFLLKLGGAAPGAGVVLRAQVWFALSLLAGGLAAALCGVLVGLPTLRLRGDYLAIATLGFGEIVRVVLLNVQQLGGASGFTGAAPFYQIPSYTNFVNVYGVALVAVFAVTALKRSNLGRALIAVREDEVAAEAVGIDTTRLKVCAFAFSAFFAGVAGGLLAHFLKLIIPSTTMFGFLRSIEVIAMVVLGGSGSTTGAVLAALALTVLPERLRDLDQWRMVLYALVLLMMMLYRRQGLLGSRELCAADWGRWWGFLRERGPDGLLARWRKSARARRHARREAWLHEGQRPFTLHLAQALWLWPVLDVLFFAPALCEVLTRGSAGAWWPLAGLPPRTCAAELVASVTGLVPVLCARSAYLKPLGRELQLPLAVGPGLALALLPLLAVWGGLARRLAHGDRRAARWLAGGALLVLWHGGGLVAAGHHGWRPVAEALSGAGFTLALAVWALTRRGGGGDGTA